MDFETAHTQPGRPYVPDPRFGSTIASNRADNPERPPTVFSELASRSRSHNGRLEAYVDNLERLVERLTGNATQNGRGEAAGKVSVAAIGELGETFEYRVHLLDRLENACNALESLA